MGGWVDGWVGEWVLLKFHVSAAGSHPGNMSMDLNVALDASAGVRGNVFPLQWPC